MKRTASEIFYLTKSVKSMYKRYVRPVPLRKPLNDLQKKINICVSDDVEKRSGMLCMYLTTALPPPWSAFRVVISTNDKVVHKTRDRVVRRHDLIRFDILASGPHLDASLANCDHFEPSGGSTT